MTHGNHLSEGCRWLEQALSESEGGVVSVRASVLNGLGLLLLNQGDYEQAERRCEESVALYRELGDMVGMAWPFHHLAMMEYDQGKFTRARSLLEECLARFSAGGDKEGRAYVLSHLALIYSEQGEYDKARSCAEESLALFKELEDNIGILEALSCLVKVLVDSQTGKAAVQPLLGEHLALAGETGRMVYALLAGRVALSQGDVATAYSLIEESLALYRAQGWRADMVEVLVVFGQVAAAQGDHAEAQSLYEESLALAREVGSKRVIPTSLEGLAAVVAVQGEPTWAARLWGTAEALRDAMGTSIPPVERADYEQSIAAARTQLGEEFFAAAWAEGHTMTSEQVLVARGPVTIPPPSPAGPPSTPPAKPAPTYPNDLTEREVEVLRLLAQGLTNAQLAEQLILSPYTVHAHVRSIFSKLGVTSRSAATRFAFEQKLV